MKNTVLGLAEYESNQSCGCGAVHLPGVSEWMDTIECPKFRINVWGIQYENDQNSVDHQPVLCQINNWRDKMKMLSSIVWIIISFCLPLMGAESDFSSKTIHMGVVVSDLEKSLKFYKDVVGMVQVDQTSFDVSAENGRKTGLTDGIPFHVEILKLGSGSEATQFKLMSFGDKAQRQDNNYISDRIGI